MHELPIIKSVYKTVIQKATESGAKKVKNVYLEVGVLRDFVPEFLKKYWNYISKDGIADGSQLLIREVPASAKCGKCGKIYDIDINDLAGAVCPDCGYEKGELVTGRELIIYGIQVE